MKPLSRIISFAAVLALTACGTEDDSVDSQPDNIRSYLTTQNLEYTERSGVFIHLVNPDRDGYETLPAAEKGDSLYLMVNGYLFTTSPGSIFYSNHPDMIAALEEEGLDADYWKIGPEKIKLGATTIVKGIREGLYEGKEGDSLRLYMPTGMAYGDKAMGLVAANSAVMYEVHITKLKK